MRRPGRGAAGTLWTLPAPPLTRVATVAALAALIAAGCELTSIDLAEVQDVVVAEVYLRPGMGGHTAFLHRTRPGPDGSHRVDGASITVRHADGQPAVVFGAVAETQVCLPLAPGEAVDRAGSCYLAGDDGSIVAGGTYDLEINLPDGRRLEGRATAPGDFDVVRPAPATCVLETTALELEWTRATGAWAYLAEAEFTGLAAGLAARGVTDAPDTLRLTGVAVSAADTSITFPGEFGVFDRLLIDIDVLVALQDGLPEGARAAIVIAAAEPNFVNWVRGGAFNPSGLVRIPSLTGDGTGMFGILVGRGREVVAPGEEAEAEGWPACGE